MLVLSRLSSDPFWGAQIAPYRRLVRVIGDEPDIDDVAKIGALNSLAAKAANVLVVVWGAPRRSSPARQRSGTNVEATGALCPSR
jgi:hypothetical protein